MRTPLGNPLAICAGGSDQQEVVLVRGHLQNRGNNSWRLKVFLGRSPDGKRRYLERTVRGTKSDAERELARLVVEADEGRWVAV